MTKPSQSAIRSAELLTNEQVASNADALTQQGAALAQEARELRAAFRERLVDMWNVQPDERQARSR